MKVSCIMPLRLALLAVLQHATFTAARSLPTHLADIHPETLSYDYDSMVKECESFLRKYMPASDQASLSQNYIDINILLALEARNRTQWASAVPWDVFLNYVLPYANFDEERDDWRFMFSAMFAPLVENCTSVNEAAMILNKRIWAFWGIVFKAEQTPAIMAPYQVIRAGYASCTGLSIFLVDALRSVGIPARVAGTPAWNQEGGGNHDWVEVWDGGWSFTGPTEWTPDGLNSTWFFPSPARLQVPGSQEHGIWATSWSTTPDGTFPMLWDEDNHDVNADDVTQYYLDAAAELGI